MAFATIINPRPRVGGRRVIVVGLCMCVCVRVCVGVGEEVKGEKSL